MRTYSPELKAQVIAEWRTGDTAGLLERRYEIPRSTIRVWTAGLVRQVVTENNRDEWDALGQEWLRESIKSLIAVLKLSQEPEWLRRQNAHDLAVFYGVNFDKSSRLIGAAGSLISGGQTQLPAGVSEDS